MAGLGDSCPPGDCHPAASRQEVPEGLFPPEWGANIRQRRRLGDNWHLTPGMLISKVPPCYMPQFPCLGTEPGSIGLVLSETRGI